MSYGALYFASVFYQNANIFLWKFSNKNWNYERQVKTVKERKKKVRHKSVDEQKIIYKLKKISLEVLFDKVATNYLLCKCI